MKKYGHQLPSWLLPILAACAGAVTVTLGGDGSVAADASLGFALGGGGPMVYEIKERVLPKPSQETADLGNG